MNTTQSLFYHLGFPDIAQKFIESKKQERQSRMEGIKNGTIKTESKTLLEKAKSALKKLVGKMSDNELFVSNEFLHNCYASIIK